MLKLTREMLKTTYQNKLFLILTVDRNQHILSLSRSFTNHLMILPHTHYDVLFIKCAICVPPIFVFRCEWNWLRAQFLKLLTVKPLIFEVGKVDAEFVDKECTPSVLMHKCAAAEVVRSQGLEIFLSLCPRADNISSTFFRAHLRPEDFV